ncbi:cellulose synthase operon protein YhjQ/BcsQ [Salinibacterium sp. G-O1]|uniref:cellulose synthase operon protein YhjQ/BcsQ n=1 Tax=Salinibacterium sp. G-O1 TaxID=3046208 RepID=UPI0024BA5869|nr:cellulose synthase operon protein YhjQ/BcsQ [Salinibacterium sp. G-O1]MDJ0333784.1 cellulose synthase operon protein YhjQ/BcsQ [Salinibacterium sp. G-O1]
MDIHEYFGVLRRGWALIALGLLVGLVGAAGAQTLQVPTYTATSRELLTTDTSGNLAQSLQATTFAEGRIASYVLVASSGLVLQPVIDELGLDMTVEELAADLVVTAPAQTLVIDITATAATPRRARDIANTTSRVFSEVVTAQVQPLTVVPVDPAAVVDPAAPPVEPVTVVPIRIVNIEKASLPPAAPSSTALILLLGSFLGLAAGLVGASLRESMDRRIRNRAGVAAITAAPVLGAIRGDRKARMSPLVVAEAPDSGIAGSFRALRANLEHVRVRGELNSFVVTGIASRQGTSTVTANLALALGNTAASVVVIDANLASPRLSTMFGASGARGLTDVLSGEATIDDVLRWSDSGDVCVLPVGTHRPRTSELLATPAMRDLLAELQGRFEVVLIDAPAISAATDAAMFALFGSGTLLVVPVGSSRPAVVDALAALELGGSVPAGIVLNKIPTGRRGRRSSAVSVSTRVAVSLAKVAPSTSESWSPVDPAWKAPTAADAIPGATPAPVGTSPVILRSRRPVQPSSALERRLASVQASGATIARRFISAARDVVGAVRTPTVVEAAPTLAVRPTAPRSSRKVVEVPSSRFAPAESAAVPSVTPRGATELVTAIPPLATSVSSRRSTRPEGSPGVAPTPTSTVAETPPSSENVGEDTSARQAARARDAHRTGPRMVTVGDYSNVTDITASVSRERIARESYALKSRELERAADERLAYEQQLVERRIREQLESRQRELDSSLDEILEDTIILPRSIVNH